jgi:hypothetical protein
MDSQIIFLDTENDGCHKSGYPPPEMEVSGDPREGSNLKKFLYVFP